MLIDYVGTHNTFMHAITHGVHQRVPLECMECMEGASGVHGVRQRAPLECMECIRGCLWSAWSAWRAPLECMECMDGASECDTESRLGDTGPVPLIGTHATASPLTMHGHHTCLHGMHGVHGV